MQISEIETKQIKNICNFLKNKKIKALYLADSLGCLDSKSIKRLIKNFKINWKNELGLHAHDNLKLALKNSLYAYKENFKWIDSTITGMGRGPGNLKTEELIKIFDNKNLKFIENLKKNYFDKLQKYYKWGPNKYYKIAAKFKIHPTYIQEMLKDRRYSKKNYSEVLKILKETDSRKYNSSKLFLSEKIYAKKPKSNWIPKRDLSLKNILIVGSMIREKKRKKIEKFIKKNKIFVIGVNTANGISEKLINLRTICHPKRIISDSAFHNKLKTTISMPYSNMPEKLKENILTQNKMILDYGILLNPKKKIGIYENYCSIPKPLAILYSICIAISETLKKYMLLVLKVTRRMTLKMMKLIFI